MPMTVKDREVKIKVSGMVCAKCHKPLRMGQKAIARKQALGFGYYHKKCISKR